jgi:ferric-dicitrate binding protein FerR (iron transport regulator)
MNKATRICKLLLLALIGAALIAPGASGLAARPQGSGGPSGKLVVTGTVTVNGTSAISGATVFSDSTVTTAKGSSAVVSLGKLGRVEVHAESTMKLSFTDSSIMVSMLEAGRVRVSSSSGVSAQATTNDGTAVATGPKMNEFTVDTSCGNTVVAVKKGRVELRAGSTVKQIAAGGQDTAGTATPGLCRGQ